MSHLPCAQQTGEVSTEAIYFLPVPRVVIAVTRRPGTSGKAKGKILELGLFMK